LLHSSGEGVPISPRGECSEGIGGKRPGDEIALRDFKFIALEGTRFRQKLVAGTGREYKEVRSSPLSLNGVTWFFTGGIHGNDVGTMNLTAGILRAFEEQTGVPVVLNTSFNDNEPIVCKPQEAIDCFARTQMDALVLGDFLITREGAIQRPNNHRSSG